MEVKRFIEWTSAKSVSTHRIDEWSSETIL